MSQDSKPTKKPADVPTNFGSLDFAQQQFLISKGLAHDRSIVDCDPMKETVTLDNGMIRTATSIYSRCMGYHRPVEFWNAGKKQEHKDRKFFVEGIAMAGVSKIESSQREAAKVLSVVSRPTHQFKQFNALSA